MRFIQKIFSPFCLIVSSLLLIFILYKDQIYWDGSKNDYFYLYYICSFLLIIFSIITFFISKKLREYLIILIISIVASVYLIEAGITFKEYLEYINQSKFEIYKKKTGKNYDKRTKLEIFNDLKKIDNKISITISPSFYLNDNINLFRLSSISNSKTIYCNENGEYSIYQSDRYGFNNPDEEWDKKEIEYLLIGDSFTHGACVNRPNDIASILRSLSNKSVINLGYGGNGPLIQYATLREYLNLKVKKVLWIYYEGNDLRDLNEELNNNILKNYLTDLTFTQQLKFKQNRINDSLNKIIIEEVKKNQKLINFIKLNKLRIVIFSHLPKKYQPNPIIKSPLIDFKNILKLSNDLVNKNDSKLYFIYLTEYGRYQKNYNNTNYEPLKKIVNELNIPFIDIQKEVFAKEENPLRLFPFEESSHYNLDGYNKVAEAIYRLSRDK